MVSGDGRQHQAGRIVDPVLGEHPLDAAQRVAEILPRLDRDIVERPLRLVRFSPDRGTGLHDRKLVAAKALRGALGAGEILGADAPVHARTMVIASEKVAERLETSVSRRSDNSSERHASRTSRAAPSRSPSASSTRASANLPLALAGRSPVKPRTVAASMRCSHSRASARRRSNARARPFRIGGDERRVAAERRDRLRMAQDVPLDELLRRRIRDLVPDVASLPGSWPCARDRWLPSPAQDRPSAAGWPPWEQARPSTASPCVVRKRVWRADFFRAWRCDGGEPLSPRATSWSASCAFWACGLWLGRAVASVEKRASPANVKKQDSERKHRFIPWSPCETHVTNTVKTKRSHDACGLNSFERYHNAARCNCHVCTTNARKMRRSGTRRVPA